MRYYFIGLSNSVTGEPIKSADGTDFGPYTSYVNGQNLPGALNIEFDIPVVTFDQPMGAAFLKIWGIPLQTIGQSTSFNPDYQNDVYTRIQIYAGMQKGLPLANPQQAGLILDGYVQQAFGNWQGTQQTLDFVINGNFGTGQNPKNIIFNWTQGQQLRDAVSQALTTAFPTASITNESTADITLPYDNQPGYYETVGQLAQYVIDVSQKIVGGSYLGIKILPVQGGFRIFDGTVPSEPRQIEFVDLIGQPTWIGPATLNFKAVMRSDIQVGDYIRMPVGPQIITAQSFSQYRDRATFQGTFQVTMVRHMGHFRQKSADSWVTVIEAVTSV